MAASYPTSIKSFTTKVDNVTDVLAAHINDLQDEIVAIETELGLLPKGSYASVLARLGGYLEVVKGTFTGDGLDNRSITVGFVNTGLTPKFVLLSGTTGGHWMFAGQANGYAYTDGSSQVNGIKSFAADSFVVGTNAEANGNGTTKYFLAIG